MSREKTIYLIRHGETEFNRMGVVQGGGVDSDLNETGRAQASAFHQQYRDIDFEGIITSTLIRTHQTVEPFTIEQELLWQQQADINEMNWGIHEGKKTSPAMRKQYKKVLDAWHAGDYDARMERGESARELGDRMLRFLDHLREREEETLLVCSHGRAMRAMVCLMKARELKEMNQFHHANTGLYKIHLRDGRFVFELENDLSHLEKAARNHAKWYRPKSK